MEEPVKIEFVEQDGEDGLIVAFSDGTTGAYLAVELLELRPHREPIELSSLAARWNQTHKQMS